MKSINTQRNTFGSDLNLAIDDLEISIFIEEACHYLETVNEDFRSEHNIKKDIDVYGGKIVSMNDKLDAFVRRFNMISNVNKHRGETETEDEASLRTFFTAIIKNRTQIPLATPVKALIERGKQISRITVIVGTEKTIDWSEILNRLFRSFPQSIFKLVEEFKFEQAIEPV